MKQVLLFNVSFVGRLGYLLLSLIPLLSSLFLLIPYAVRETLSWWMLILFFLIILANFGLFIYAISQAFRHAPRFTASRMGLKFNGLLVNKEINWKAAVSYQSFRSFRFGLSSVRIDYIDNASGRRKKLYFDTNGLYPDDSELCATIGYYMHVHSNRL